MPKKSPLVKRRGPEGEWDQGTWKARERKLGSEHTIIEGTRASEIHKRERLEESKEEP